MKQNNTWKPLLIAVTAALSLTGARADVPLDNPPPEAAAGQGLLGQNYANLTYSYYNLDNTSAHADGFTFGFNHPLQSGLDAVFAYDWTQTGLIAGDRLNTQGVTAGLRAFSHRFIWGKPYVEAGAGFAWQSFGGSDDNSFVWNVAIGTELQLAPALTVTPFVQYADAPDLAGDGALSGGVKANYWVDSQWAVTASLILDDDQNTAFTVGTNFRF